MFRSGRGLASRSTCSRSSRHMRSTMKLGLRGAMMRLRCSSSCRAGSSIPNVRAWFEIEGVGTMELTGEMLIGAHAIRGKHGSVQALNPATCAVMEPAFGGGSSRDVDAACDLAEAAFDTFRSTSLEQRAAFLEAIAPGILDLGDTLVERVMAESGLPRPRVEGERGRTVGQLRLFASLTREGRWLNATIDPPQPDRKPAAKPDLRSQKIALGPVAVF